MFANFSYKPDPVELVTTAPGIRFRLWSQISKHSREFSLFCDLELNVEKLKTSVKSYCKLCDGQLISGKE